MFNFLKSYLYSKHRLWILYTFFASLFFYTLFFIIEPEILYYKLQPFFSFDKEYIQFQIDFRYGYLSLISQFFLQFLYFPLIGSLILAALLVLLSLLYRKIFQQSLAKGFSGIEFLLAIIFLYFFKNYTAGIETLISLLIAGIIFIIVESFSKNILLKFLAQILLLPLLIISFGIFPVLILLILFFPKKWENLKASSVLFLYFIVILIAFFAAYLHFGLKILEVQFKQISFFSPSVAFPGYWIFCFVIVLVTISSYIPSINLIKEDVTEKSFWKSQLFFPFFMLLIYLISLFSVFINPDKYKAEMDIHVLKRDWDKVLSYSDVIGKQDRHARFQLNRALFANARMSEDLFSIPQDWGEYSLLLSKELSMESMPYLSDLYFDLGFIKASKYCILEYQTANPYSPYSLERLALTSLILGELETCSKYYTILSKSIIYKPQYLQLLSKLKKQPYLLMTESVPKNIALINGDEIINLKEPEKDLYNILKVSPQNKMAFEYLMSYNILRNDLESFYTLLPLVAKSGYYKKMPKTWEEALILYNSENSIPLNSGISNGMSINIERYQKFKGIFEKNKSNVNHLKEALQPEFQTSFWYYRYFVNPDLGNKIKKSK